MTTAVTKSTTVQLRDFRHSLPMELLRAREAAMVHFRPMLRSFGLTEQQWRVLRALSEVDGLDAGELAERSFLLAPSLTRILQYLEQQGLVTRTADKSDQRKSVVALAKKGRQLFERVAPESEAMYARIESEFGVDRIETLYEILADFSAKIGTAGLR